MGGAFEVTREGALRLFGVTLVGVTADSGKKLLLTAGFILFLLVLNKLLRLLVRLILPGERNLRQEFWTRQALHVITAMLLIIGVVSIWFNNPAQLTTAAGLVTAGLAFALQKVITAIAGYVVILRGKTFNVGDRIMMASVRGDVIELGFIQTTIMEMGQPPGEQGDAPSMWVRSRQYTGRIVTITNDKIFDEPVYNYSREFPYIWEEMIVPVSYKSDRSRAEGIILEATRKNTIRLADMGEEALAELERRYFIKREELEPRVYLRLTDNWVEMTVRFVVESYGIRAVKDRISREIMDKLDEAGIGIASGTYEVVGFPPLRVKLEQ